MIFTLLQFIQIQYLSFSNMFSNLIGDYESNLRWSSIILQLLTNNYSNLSYDVSLNYNVIDTSFNSIFGLKLINSYF